MNLFLHNESLISLPEIAFGLIILNLNFLQPGEVRSINAVRHPGLSSPEHRRVCSPTLTPCPDHKDIQAVEMYDSLGGPYLYLPVLCGRYPLSDIVRSLE